MKKYGTLLSVVAAAAVAILLYAFTRIDGVSGPQITYQTPVELFKRGSDFDPKTECVVFVDAHNQPTLWAPSLALATLYAGNCPEEIKKQSRRLVEDRARGQWEYNQQR